MTKPKILYILDNSFEKFNPLTTPIKHDKIQVMKMTSLILSLDMRTWYFRGLIAHTILSNIIIHITKNNTNPKTKYGILQ